jgi:beta-galactosidase
LAESFDEWAKPKVENGYHRFFEDYAEKDIVNLVQATRNHLYCDVELWKRSAGSVGRSRSETRQMVAEIFHREDPTRPVTVGMDQVKATMESGLELLDSRGIIVCIYMKKHFQNFLKGLF